MAALSFDEFYSKAKQQYGNLPDDYIASEYKRLSGVDPVLTDPKFKDKGLGDPGFLKESLRTLKSNVYAPTARFLGAGLGGVDALVGKGLRGLGMSEPDVGTLGDVGYKVFEHANRVQEENQPSAALAAKSVWNPYKLGQNVIGAAGQIATQIPTGGAGIMGMTVDQAAQFEGDIRREHPDWSNAEVRARSLALAGGTMALEQLGIGRLLKGVPGKIAAGLAEGSTEVAQQGLQDVLGNKNPVTGVGDAIATQGLPAFLVAAALGKSGRAAQPSAAGKANFQQTLQEQQVPLAQQQETIPEMPSPAAPITGINETAPVAPQQVIPTMPPTQEAIKGIEPDAPPVVAEDNSPTVELPTLQEDGLSVAEPTQPYAAQGPVFFSGLERLVDQAKAPRATGEQWAGYLKNKGAKSEELAWTGADEWLKSQKGGVSKDELLNYVRDHKVDVQEVTLGRDKRNGEDEQTYMEAEDAFARGDDPTGTKFSQYQLPGGENYRELLLTLPTSGEGGKRVKVYTQDGLSAVQVMTDAQIEKMRESGRRKFEVLDTVNPASSFQSSHFDQPNVLAHVRFNERTDAEGKKVLFVEEIQSDWHQKGRKVGYRQNQSIEKLKAELAAVRATQESEKRGSPAHDEAILRESEIVNQLNSEQHGGAVPDAPFKTTWPELSMKRMVRWAAEHGFDRIAWTPGEVQADRYDLSKHVDELKLYQRADGTGYNLNAKKGGAMVLAKQVANESELADHIGKEPAKKLFEQFTNGTANADKGARVEGADLKLGGEGMRGFYDKILVDTANKLGKRFGAKVGKTTIKADNAPEEVVRKFEAKDPEHPFVKKNRMPAHSLDITPAMRESVMQGQSIMEPVKGYNASNDYKAEGYSVETRVGTTPEQVRTGSAFMGRLIGWRDRMAGASVLADGLTRDFTDKGFTPIVGQSARSPGDLAALAQVYRDPRVETLRLFVMKGDRIVAQTGLAQRLPGGVNFAAPQWDTWNQFIRANGGDGYYLLHNHPSGNAKPSTADQRMTSEAIGRIPSKFRGHVIVDHNQYGVMRAGELPGVVERPFNGYDPGKNPRMESEWLGKQITGPVGLARIASGIGAKPSEITVITTDAANGVKSITSFPGEAFNVEEKRSPKGKLKFLQAAARIRRLRAASGSGGHTFAVTNDAIDLREAWSLGLFTDVVDLESGEAVGERWANAGGSSTAGQSDREELFRTSSGRSRVTQVAEPTGPYQRDTENTFGGNRPPPVAQQATPAAPIPSHVDAGGGHYSTAPLSGVSPEASRIILDVMQAEDANIAHQRRGEMPRTWAQTGSAAKELLESDFGPLFNSLVNRLPGTTANAEKLEALAQIVNAGAVNVQKAVAQYNQTNSAQDLARLAASREQLGVALAPFMGYRTEAGRALNILRKVQADFADAQKIFELLGDGQAGAVEDFARKVKDAGSVAEVLKITQASYKPTLLDQIREYWINMGLLSGPWTHVANLTSTWLYGAVESGTELGTSLFSKNISTAAALKRFTGMLSGVQLGIANAGKAFSTETPQLTQQMQIDSAKYRTIPGKLGRVVRTPGRALIAEDEFNKAILYSGELHRLAMDESERTKVPFDQVLRSYANDRAKQDEAKKYAERLTFQTPLGAIGRRGMAFRDSIPFAGWFLVPFVRTPTNIIKRFAEYTPAGMVMPTVLSDLKAGGRAGALAKGRMLVGSATMAAVASQVLGGLMTGAGPADDDERALWMRTGRKPYSVKVNGEWVKYNRLEPVGMLLGIAADMTEMSRTALAKDAKGEEVATLALASFMTNLGDKTFLRGITDFMQATTDPTRYMAQWASNQAATLAVPNVLAQSARAKDPYVRDARSTVDAIRGRVPGLREELPAKLDVSGQPIERSVVEPFASSEQVQDPLAEAMLRLGANKGSPSRTLTVRGRSYEMTPAEYEDYKSFVQQARWRVLTPLVNSPQFKQAEGVSTLATKDQLERVYDKIGGQARDVWLIQHPDVIKKIASQSVQSSTGSQYIQ